MNILEEISDIDIFGKSYDFHSKHFLVRRATRGVLVDDEGLIYLVYFKSRGIYKLPGGGVDPGESVLDGLKREIKEEAGVEFEIKKELGITVETRYYEGMETGLFQMSYSYILKIKGEKLNTSFMPDEIEEGATPVWLSLEDAISKYENYALPDYESHFIKHRELKILEEAKKYLR